MSANTKNTYDAIVVGSGMSGGWAAKELAEKGLATLVLERGRNVEHVKDYPTAFKDPWELEYGNELTQKDQEEYAIQKGLWLLKQDTKHFFVKDTEHPYNQVKPFNWYRGYQAGGKSLMWSRHCFRLSDIDFEANAKEGIGLDWPIRYRDIAPWYDYVEEFIGVSGENAGLAQLPDQRLLPPLEMNCIEAHVKERLAKRYADRRMIVARVAVLTRPHKGRGACQSRNMCARGCPFGAYFSSNSSTLPAAAKTGNMTLRPFSIVHSIIMFVPVVAVAINHHWTMVGRFATLRYSPTLRFVVLGAMIDDPPPGATFVGESVTQAVACVRTWTARWAAGEAAPSAYDERMSLLDQLLRAE